MSFKRRRSNAYRNKKKQEKKKRLREEQEQSSMFNENDTHAEEELHAPDHIQSLMVMEFDTHDEDKKRQEQDLIFDSGCTAHMWNHRAHFTSFEP